MNTVFCFADMFYPHIKDSKLKLPPDFKKYDKRKYPHFTVFMNTHLGFPINPITLCDNANIIANLSDEEIRTVSIGDLMAKGMAVSHSTVLD